MNVPLKSGIAVVIVMVLWAFTAKVEKEALGAGQPSETAAAGGTGPVTIIYPRDGSVFPADMAAPIFRWKDSSDASAWRITVHFKERREVLAFETAMPRWRPTKEEWAEIRRFSTEKAATVSVTGIKGAKGPRDGTPPPSTSVTIRTAADPVTAPIFYREVRLPVTAALSSMETTRWRLGDVSSHEPPRVVLQGMRICANCHSVTRDGKTLGMDVDVDNDKGAYIITDIEKEVLFTKERVITWNAFMRDGRRQNFGLFSRFSPDGRYVISTIRELPIYRLFPDPGNPQLFFPVQGILALYDRRNRTFSTLPGADDPAYVQTNAVWSPDGKWIVFARARALDSATAASSFKEGCEVFRYDLYRLPFNGGKGGKAEPLAGASANGRSNYFPRFTPDGKWLIYTRSNSFMINQPDAELHIIPAQGGEDRKMACNTPGKMSSWHSPSPNGKWLVFSSKANGPFTELWLTHLDSEGNDTPPVLLEDFTDPDKAANLPEFLDIAPEMFSRIENRLD